MPTGHRRTPSKDGEGSSISCPGSAIDRRAIGLTPIQLRKVDGSVIDREIAGAPFSSHEVSRSVLA
jgi:hypothetical protein